MLSKEKVQGSEDQAEAEVCSDHCREELTELPTHTQTQCTMNVKNYFHRFQRENSGGGDSRQMFLCCVG